MTAVDRLFEAHLRVRSLAASIAFYRDALGLEVAHVTPDGNAAFLWVGGRGRTMLGLWGNGLGPAPAGSSHVAFAAPVGDVLGSPQTLRSMGIAPLDFDLRPTGEPVVLGWMPAAAVYFRDPDGHLLEFIAMLDGDARPDAGVVTWSEWIGRHAPSTPDTAESIRVLAICGSLREGSSNRAVVDAAVLLAPAGTRMRVFNGLDAIPPFNPDFDVDPAPMGVARFRDALKASDAVLISSPEYAHGVSGVMKNALDWVVGSGEFVDKPVALVNATSRATIAHTSLRETLVTMSARMVDEASVTVPLDGKRLDGAAIARDVRLSGLLRSAIDGLTGPVRAGRPSDRAPARP